VTAAVVYSRAVVAATVEAFSGVDAHGASIYDPTSAAFARQA